MRKTAYTLMLIPDKETSSVKHINLSPRVINFLKISGAVGGFVLIISLFSLYQSFQYKYDYQRVNSENKSLKENIVAIEWQIKSIEKAFSKINEFSKKVEMLTELDKDSKDLMAIGPLTEEEAAALALQKKKSK